MNNKSFYFDNAATTAVKPQEVADAVYKVLASGEYGNPSRGAHMWSVNSYRIVYQARCALAEFFNVIDENHVIFTLNATMGLNIAIKGLLQANDHVITTSFEHNSVIRPLYQLKSIGVTHDVVSCSAPEGKINYSDFEKLLKPNTKMVVCNHASNVIGNLIDLEIVSKFCQKHNLLFVVDASQSAGVFPIDMQKLNIAALCIAGHKSLYGPQGTGILCLGKDILPDPLLTGGSGESSFNPEPDKILPQYLEAGTVNTHGIAGLLAGIQYINQVGMDHLRNQQLTLAHKFYLALKDCPELRFYGDYETEERSAVVALNVGDNMASEIAAILDENFNIAVRPGAHCAPWVHDQLGTSSQGIIRFSFSSFTTESEIEHGIKAVKEIIALIQEGAADE